MLLVLALAAVAAIPLTALWQAFGPKGNVAPDFTLTDQHGLAFTLSAQRGHPVVLFFGYTHCPDACPTTLAHLAKAVTSPSVPADVRVAFITVDPYRDSPAVLKRYVALFNPSFRGLTGSLATLNPIYSAYHSWRQAVPVRHGPDNYSMAHGTTIYYIGRSGALNGIGHWDDDTPTMLVDLKEYQ